MNKQEFDPTAFFNAIEEVAKVNLMSPEEVLNIIEETIFKTFHTKFDPDAELELVIDKDKKEFKLINKTKMVIDGEVEEKYRAIEISLEDAKKIDPNAKDGGVVAEEVMFKEYSQQVFNQVKQLLTQQTREKRKLAIYAKHKALKGEMIDVEVTTNNNNYATFILDDGTSAYMPRNFKNPNIVLSPGMKVKVYVEDVLEESKDAQIIVSNGSPRMIRRLLEAEVPEIADGIIEIVKISRIPGERSKVAVKSLDPNVDAAGSIIGAQGSRIKVINEKLEGERLDIIKYSADTNEFVINAISPAKVVSISDKKDEEGNVIEGYKVVVTPNRHQTLAIGRRGSNARLTVELTHTRIDVLSIKEAEEKGIEILWNGNVQESQLEDIENGIRQTYNRPQRRQNTFESQDTGMRDEINSFNEDLFESFSSNNSYDDVEEFDSAIESGFALSDDELAKIEDDFNFDTEIASMDDIDESDYADFNFDDAELE